MNLDKSNYKKYKMEDIAENISLRVNPNTTNAEIYVGLEHLEPGCIHIREYGKPADVKGVKLKVEKGDIIFGKRRAYQRKAAIAEFDGICSAHAMVLRANPKVILPELIPFFMHSDVFMNRAIDISEGSLSPTIKWKILKEQVFLLPPLEEQTKLADLLWAGDKTLQKYVELKNVFSLYSRVKVRSIVKECSILSSKKLRELVSVITKGTTPTTSGDSYKQEGVNFFKVESFDNNGDIIVDKIAKIDADTHIKQKRSILFAGDILFSIAGYIGRTALIDDSMLPANINQALAIIRLKSEYTYLREFIYVYLNTWLVNNHFEKLSTQTAQVNINLAQLGDLDIPIFSDESTKVFTELDIRNRELASVIEISITHAETINKSLINQIFA